MPPGRVAKEDQQGYTLLETYKLNLPETDSPLFENRVFVEKRDVFHGHAVMLDARVCPLLRLDFVFVVEESVSDFCT